MDGIQDIHIFNPPTTPSHFKLEIKAGDLNISLHGQTGVGMRVWIKWLSHDALQSTRSSTPPSRLYQAPCLSHPRQCEWVSKRWGSVSEVEGSAEPWTRSVRLISRPASKHCGSAARTAVPAGLGCGSAQRWGLSETRAAVGCKNNILIAAQGLFRVCCRKNAAHLRMSLESLRYNDKVGINLGR